MSETIDENTAPDRSVAGMSELLARGIHLQAAGNLSAAKNIYEKILDQDRQNGEALHQLGRVSILMGDPQRAIALIQRAIHFGPPSDIHYNSLAMAYDLAKDAVNTAAAYQKALALNPHNAEAHLGLGLLYKKKRAFQPAIEHYRKAIAINPVSPTAFNNMGTAFFGLGDFVKAMACFRKALAFDPTFFEALLNLGNTFQKTGDLKAAIACYQKVLNADSPISLAHLNMGIAYQAMGRIEAAIDAFEHALRLDPDNAKATAYLVHQYQHVCNWAQVARLGKKLDRLTTESIASGQTPAETPFLSISRQIDPFLNHTIAKLWSLGIQRRVSVGKQFIRPAYRAASDKKIVLGYLSNNFRNHATAHLLSGLFRRHDRRRFKIHCYSWGQSDNSIYRKRVANDCDRFVDLDSCGYLQAAEKIRSDGVDILIDLVGHTKGNRLEISALRPAPVQVRWLGLAGTTGASFFDYLITDSIVTPLTEAVHYSEKFVFMPHTYHVSDPIEKPRRSSSTNAESGLEGADIVFCSFCANYKIEEAVFSTWMRILSRVEGSVLWLLPQTESVRAAFAEEARRRGVSPQRIIFADKMDKSLHLARLHLAHIALDTRTVNGAATTSDALRADVPVITLRGGHFASRMSSSILSAVGMSELITDDLKRYEELAVALATDSSRLEKLTQKLKQNKKTYPLFDTRRFVKDIERAFSAMWQAFLEGRDPCHISVREID